MLVMKNALFTVLLFMISLSIFSQRAEDIFSAFNNQECVKSEAINEDEWKFARYAFSNISASFYEKNKSEQQKDTINSNWFNKVFTYNENGYSLDFEKIKTGAAKINSSEIPDVKEFIFIGMQMPILQSATSITSLKLRNCGEELKDKFDEKFNSIKPFYDILISQELDSEKNIVMKNKEDEPFSEVILLSQIGESYIDLVYLKGTFYLSDITPPKDSDD